MPGQQVTAGELRITGLSGSVLNMQARRDIFAGAYITPMGPVSSVCRVHRTQLRCL